MLWIGNVGSPSSGKSPGIDKALAVLKHAEDYMSIGLRRSSTRPRTAEADGEGQARRLDDER